MVQERYHEDPPNPQNKDKSDVPASAFLQAIEQIEGPRSVL
jgi:hypothetical protein